MNIFKGISKGIRDKAKARLAEKVKNSPDLQANSSFMAAAEKFELRKIKNEAKKIRDGKLAKPVVEAQKKAEAALNKKKQIIKDKIKAAEENAKTKKPATKKKKPTPPESKSRENQRNARGAIVARLSPQGNKKEGVGSMVAYTSISRAKGKLKAGQDLRSGKITQAEHDKIIKEIDRLNEAEMPRRAGDGPKRKKQPYKPESPFNKGGMPMVKKDGKSIPAFAADGVGKMMKGGMAKAKPRTGNTDYRMGGMFMKSGKK